MILTADESAVVRSHEEREPVPSNKVHRREENHIKSQCTLFSGYKFLNEPAKTSASVFRTACNQYNVLLLPRVSRRRKATCSNSLLPHNSTPVDNKGGREAWITGGFGVWARRPLQATSRCRLHRNTSNELFLTQRMYFAIGNCPIMSCRIRCLVVIGGITQIQPICPPREEAFSFTKRCTYAIIWICNDGDDFPSFN
jgi:hypothetical protein